MKTQTEDRIIYLKISNGGGVDGMDHKDKGGRILAASYDREEIEALMDGWSHLRPTVMDIINKKKATLKKLDPVERLVLGFGRKSEKEKTPSKSTWMDAEGNEHPVNSLVRSPSYCYRCKELIYCTCEQKGET